MNEKENEKFLKERKKMQSFINFMLTEHGITTEKMLDDMDIVKKYSLE